MLAADEGGYLYTSAVGTGIQGGGYPSATLIHVGGGRRWLVLTASSQV